MSTRREASIIRFVFQSTCAWCLVLSLPLGLWSAEPDAAGDVARKERLELMKRQAGEYSVMLNLETPSRLVLHEDALLRFSNPVSGVPDGIIVMWKDGARPAIFAQVFQVKDGQWVHECQSLARASLRLQRGRETFWKPRKSAEEFRPLSDSPIAAESPVKRLVQMKALAATFSATDDFKINPGDKESTRNMLRLLPTPVYRYEEPTTGVQDGAVFAFVHGTDPELFLVLEHRSGPEGKAGWFYSLTPMTCWAVNVSRQNTEIWSIPERINKSTIRDPYYVWLYRPNTTQP